MTTTTVVIMILIGFIIIIASFFITESLIKKEENYNVDLMTVDDNYEFSEREQRIIKRKIEDAIADQAKDILYETNDSLAAMANEKTIALGDYAVAVCDEIEKNHKEVMFLYSMLEDKQKEIMKTVHDVNKARADVKQILSELGERFTVKMPEKNVEERPVEKAVEVKRQTAIDQLTALRQMKAQLDIKEEEQTVYSGDNMKSDFETAYVLQESKDAAIHTDNEDVTQDALEEDGILDDDKDKSFEEMDQTEIVHDEVLEQESADNENSNEIILKMYRDGDNVINIAKQLGLGVGEVKLVIDLYKGE